jgi:hypothetical protein
MPDQLKPASIETAPRDGTHVLGLIVDDPDHFVWRGYAEWREIWWEPREEMFRTVWCAGGPGHDGRMGSERYGEGLVIAWLPCPPKPQRP